jgi:hypothetical protein
MTMMVTTWTVVQQTQRRRHQNLQAPHSIIPTKGPIMPMVVPIHQTKGPLMLMAVVAITPMAILLVHLFLVWIV